jgi:hypothetical protein
MPEVEKNWLNVSTKLLLNLTKKSPDFARVLFEPLANCEFKEYRIDTSFNRFSKLLSYNLFSIPMTPMFSSQIEPSVSCKM